MRFSSVSFRRAVAEIGRPSLLFLGWVTVGHLVVHWYVNLLFLVLPFLKADMNLTNVQLGTITTAQMAIAGGLTLFSGYLADSFRKQGPLILTSAILAFGLAYFMMGTATLYVEVIMAAGLVGLGSALWHPAAMGALSLQFPDRRGMALSVHGVGASLGDSLAPIAVGATITVIAWQRTLQLHLIPALLVAGVLWKGLGAISLGKSQRPSFRSYASGIRSLITNRQVLGVMSSTALISMSRLSVLTFLPIYISETLGYSPFILGVYLSLLYVMGIISQPVMGIVSDKLGRKAVMVPSFASMGLLYVAIGLANPGLQLGLVIAVLGLFFYAILNISQSAIMDVAEEGVQASTMGVMSLFSQPFTIVSPVLAGYLATEFGIKSVFWYAASTALLATLILLPTRLRRSS